MKKVYILLVLITIIIIMYITMHGSKNVKVDSVYQPTSNVRIT